MWEFQIEPVNAEELPFHLLGPLKGVFESRDPLMRKAAESHRDQLAQHLELVRGLDYSRLLAECHDFTESFNSHFRTRQRLDAQRYLALAKRIEMYQEARTLIPDRFFSLVAIGLFAADSSRDEVVSFLDGQAWTIMHGVLTRWGWIKRHHELLKDGKKLSAPYSCSLSPQGETFDQDDEEFNQLLSFLHILRLATGRELLFVEKRQRPDFKLETKAGLFVGAEMTEAWTSRTWAKEFIASAQAMRFLDQRLQGLGAPVHVRLETPRSWRSLRKRKAEVADWIISKVIDVGIPTEKGAPYWNPDLNLKIKISPSEQPRPSISYGSFASSGPRLFDSSKQLDAMHTSLQKRIIKKLSTPPPAFMPCLLAVHPVHDLDVDMEGVISEFFQHPKLDVSSHFSEVWLVGVKHAVQLI